MISFKLSELAILGNYKLKGLDKEILKVSLDSRACKDALFVAIKGEKFDGHSFIEKALENGAVAIVSEQKLDEAIEEKTSVIYVNNTVEALGFCGLLVRRQGKAKILSLTGSCGKTTTKEFTQAILSLNGISQCTQGNFNNDIGVPLTLMSLDKDTDFLVVEQGASHLFDIEHTCRYIKADYAVINNVGEAHIEGFGSALGVYRGKSQIIDSVLANGGFAAVPSDSPFFSRWQEEYKAAFKSSHLVSFGSHDFDYVQFKNVLGFEDSISFTLVHQGKSLDINLKLMGTHNASNAAAACTLALLAGASFDTVKQGLENAASIKGRLCLNKFENFSVVDDTYNASFNAVLSAIDSLSNLKGQRVLVLGDMGELGDSAITLHQKVGEYAKGKIDKLLCIGPLCEHTAKGAGDIAMHFTLHQDLLQYATNLIKPMQYVSFLVKGSHAMHMDTISKELIALGEK